VDVPTVRRLWGYLRAHPEARKIDLSGDLALRESSKPHGDGLVKAAANYQYRGSLQAAIWRRDYLLEACAGEFNPWQFERRTCRKGLILGVTQPAPLHYVNAVGGEGNLPGQYDHKKIPGWMWNELVQAKAVAA
jgi:hypothetical protein